MSAAALCEWKTRCASPSRDGGDRLALHTRIFSKKNDRIRT